MTLESEDYMLFIYIRFIFIYLFREKSSKSYAKHIHVLSLLKVCPAGEEKSKFKFSLFWRRFDE